MSFQEHARDRLNLDPIQIFMDFRCEEIDQIPEGADPAFTSEWQIPKYHDASTTYWPGEGSGRRKRTARSAEKQKLTERGGERERHQVHTSLRLPTWTDPSSSSTAGAGSSHHHADQADSQQHPAAEGHLSIGTSCAPHGGKPGDSEVTAGRDHLQPVCEAGRGEAQQGSATCPQVSGMPGADAGGDSHHKGAGLLQQGVPTDGADPGQPRAELASSKLSTLQAQGHFQQSRQFSTQGVEVATQAFTRSHATPFLHTTRRWAHHQPRESLLESSPTTWQLQPATWRGRHKVTWTNSSQNSD